MKTSPLRLQSVLLAALLISLAVCSQESPPPAAPETARQANAEAVTEPVDDTQVIVVGDIDEAIANLKAEDWWGQDRRGEQLTAPHVMLAGISPAWQNRSRNLSVADKKEVFYRMMLPLILHANEMVRSRRDDLVTGKDKLSRGQALSAVEIESLRRGAVIFRVRSKEVAAGLTADSPDLGEIIDELLYKLDIVPAGLALGQAAYESGYATSRFAIEGNALFGQWTFGGEGLVPDQQRASLGDHRIAAFDWPFDSVRAYFINLNSHPAYEEFRRLRAQMRNAGQPLHSMKLADGLIRYSERGQEYVDTLKQIIRVNEWETADRVTFRDESVRFVLGAESPEAVASITQQIEGLRKSGELEQIIARMRLE